MFPRGPRFPAARIPDVPGPNSYNPQDPEYDAYKRGAFLEKTNRFAKDKVADGPEPGAYNSDNNTAHTKTSTGSGKATADRYAVLQRKVEDLERLHAEGKKAHHLELERLKLDLSRAQKSNAEHSERAEKLKKQNDALEARMQELKKGSAAEHGELREMRTKLKVAEHERAAHLKAGEAGDVKKALQATEARRKDEVRERDRKIAELEKALSLERKKRETVEAKLADVRAKVNDELQEARATASRLESELQGTKVQAQDAQSMLKHLKTRAADREDDLLERLEHHRALLARVAEEYGRLASTTVSKALHSHSNNETVALQLRVFRLERKLANTEGQAVELANLVRYTKEENALLSARLREANAEVIFYSLQFKDTAREERLDPLSWRSLQEGFDGITRDLHQSQLTIHNILLSDNRSWADLYRLQCDALLRHSSILLGGLDEAENQVRQSASQLSVAEARSIELRRMLESAHTAHATTEQQLAETNINLETSRMAEASLKRQLEDARAQAEAEISRVQQMLQKEKEAIKRLVETLQKNRIAEEALQADIEQLSSELAEAERYQEAYNNLIEEVDALVARNALAEEEAARLSKFNAEIVGHNNPAQRIVYVDRIRRELHEAKQKLLMSTREKDTVQSHNEDLQHELELYKSVAVPQELKPRTTVTRVERVTLPTENMYLNGSKHAETAKHGEDLYTKRLEAVAEIDTPGNMTLDDIS